MKILVKTKTYASVESVERLDSHDVYFPNKASVMDAYVVSVKAMPTKGFANKAIILLLAKHLDIALSLIKIVSGARSAYKVFEIQS